MAQEKQRYDGHVINFSSNTGYPTIYIDGKNVLLHRYVWEKHHGTIPDGFEIHHKDKNRHNYDLSNLEMVCAVEHHRQHAVEGLLGRGNKGKRKDHVSGFCGQRRPVTAFNAVETVEFESISHASRTLDVRPSDISRVLRGERKTAKGWCFADGFTGKIV